jgi:hypothetical protein
MAVQAYGGLAVQDGGAQTQALTTSFGQLVAFSAALGGISAADSNTFDGDIGVRPDAANNRLLLECPAGPKNSIPGQPDPYTAYEITFDLSAIGGGSVQDVVAQVYVNGVARADMSGRSSFSSANRTQLGFTAYLKLTVADNPKNILTFPDPGTTPAPRYAGAGGAPDNMCPVTIYLKTIASTLTLTIEACHFNAQKMA